MGQHLLSSQLGLCMFTCIPERSALNILHPLVSAAICHASVQQSIPEAVVCSLADSCKIDSKHYHMLSKAHKNAMLAITEIV